MHSYNLVPYEQSEQMGNLFSDLSDSLSQSISDAAAIAKKKAEQALADSLARLSSNVLNTPALQQAAVDSANQAAVDALANQLHSGSSWFVKNKQTVMIAGGVVMGLIALSLLKKK